MRLMTQGLLWFLLIMVINFTPTAALAQDQLTDEEFKKLHIFIISRIHEGNYEKAIEFAKLYAKYAMEKYG